MSGWFRFSLGLVHGLFKGLFRVGVGSFRVGLGFI